MFRYVVSPPPACVLPTKTGGKCGLVAMLHVPSTSASIAHCHAERMGLVTQTPKGMKDVAEYITMLASEHTKLRADVIQLNQAGCEKCRSVAFLTENGRFLLNGVASTPFFAALVDRAMAEMAIYYRHGVRNVEIENISAPYFIGAGECLWEDLIAIAIVALAVRREYPDVCIGLHILSSNELEALPIAIMTGAAFVRSEATMFAGMRPEGTTNNHGNLARFLYMRRVLRNLCAPPSHRDRIPADSALPQIWTDVQKKHTLFPAELQPLSEWLHNISFVKLEGVIITGPATGSNCDEKDLRDARAAVDAARKFADATVGPLLPSAEGAALPPDLPLVTGSGSDFALYTKYVDFVIVGTALKRGGYWENPVDEEAVQRTIAVFDASVAAAV